MLNPVRTKEVLNKFGKRVQQQARTNLTKGNIKQVVVYMIQQNMN